MGTIAAIFKSELARLQSEGKIETVGRLKIWKDGPTGPSGLYYVKIWTGNKARPAYYSFRSLGQRDAYIARELASEAATMAQRKLYDERGAADLATFLETIQVGTLLHYSWGYDQTNCEFFQVVERRGRLVTIRAIEGEYVKGDHRMSGGQDMSCRLRPKRDAFLEGAQAETLTKRIGAHGISMDFGSAHPCLETESFYCSWYA